MSGNPKSSKAQNEDDSVCEYRKIINEFQALYPPPEGFVSFSSKLPVQEGSRLDRYMKDFKRFYKARREKREYVENIKSDLFEFMEMYEPPPGFINMRHAERFSEEQILIDYALMYRRYKDAKRENRDPIEAANKVKNSSYMREFQAKFPPPPGYKNIQHLLSHKSRENISDELINYGGMYQAYRRAKRQKKDPVLAVQRRVQNYALIEKFLKDNPLPKGVKNLHQIKKEMKVGKAKQEHSDYFRKYSRWYYEQRCILDPDYAMKKAMSARDNRLSRGQKYRMNTAEILDKLARMTPNEKQEYENNMHSIGAQKIKPLSDSQIEEMKKGAIGFSNFNREVRRGRITGTKIGRIVNNKTADLAVLADTINATSYSGSRNFLSEAMELGVKYEERAALYAKELLGLGDLEHQYPVGFTPIKELPFIGATPDILIDKNVIVEMKFSAKPIAFGKPYLYRPHTHITTEMPPPSETGYFLKNTQNTKRRFKARPNHPYYYQTVAQMVACNAEKGYICAYHNNGSENAEDFEYFVQPISKTDAHKLWARIEPSLIEYYKKYHLAPEDHHKIKPSSIYEKYKERAWRRQTQYSSQASQEDEDDDFDDMFDAEEDDELLELFEKAFEEANECSDESDSEHESDVEYDDESEEEKPKAKPKKKKSSSTKRKDKSPQTQPTSSPEKKSTKTKKGESAAGAGSKKNSKNQPSTSKDNPSTSKDMPSTSKASKPPSTKSSKKIESPQPKRQTRSSTAISKGPLPGEDFYAGKTSLKDPKDTKQTKKSEGFLDYYKRTLQNQANTQSSFGRTSTRASILSGESQDSRNQPLRLSIPIPSFSSSSSSSASRTRNVAASSSSQPSSSRRQAPSSSSRSTGFASGNLDSLAPMRRDMMGRES